MEKSYNRLEFGERIEIEKLLSHNKNCKEIAIHLGRHKSTVSREIRRLKGENYNSMKSHFDATIKSSDRKFNKTKLNANPDLKKFIYEHLALRWSPEQIVFTLKIKFPFDKAMQISIESIYFHIYLHTKSELRKLLISQLRQERKIRGNTRRGADKRTTIKDPVRIDERPEEVLGRQVPGHWEGDLIMGKDRASAIGTLAERTTRTVIIVPLKKRDSESVRKAFEREFKSIPRQMKKTLTYDNGTEMAQHKLFTTNTKIQVYFAHPYSPWERPTNENTNGLIRDYFPAGTDFSLISKKRLKEVQNQLNERPRKVLGYQTPKEVFESYILKNVQ